MKLKAMIYALTALALTACSNDENFDNQNGPVELRLTSGVSVQTRAFQATQGTSISKNEVVNVWVDDAETAPQATPLYQAVQLTANGSNGFTGAPLYFPQTGNKIDIYAMHGHFKTPFAQGNAFPKDAIEYAVEADQSKVANYTKSDLLYAYNQGVARNGNPTTVNLTFYHMLSKLELAIKVGNGAPELAASNAVTLKDVTLEGTFTPSTTAVMSNAAQRAPMLGNATTATTANMTLGQQTCADFTQNVVYNEAILVPQDLSGKKLEFKLKNGGTLTYTIPQSTTFESGKKYLYHITLDLTGVQVKSIIVDWEPVAAVEGNAEMQ